MDIQREKKSGIQKKHLLYGLIGALALVFILWLVFGNHSSTMSIDKKSVTISEVTYGIFNDYIRVSGKVEPISVVQISPEEGGIVMEKVAEEGTFVNKGDVIMRLSNSSLDLQILNAESEVAEKQNMLRNTQVTMQQDKLNNETEKANLDIDMTRKRRAYNQYSKLYKEKLVSREEYLKAKEDYELADRKYLLINKRLKQDSLYRYVQMDQMEDNLTNMRRNVDMIRERKHKLEVVAPISGELGLLDVELGQSVQPGQKVGQIYDQSDFKVVAEIDEHYIDRVVPGLEAYVKRQNRSYKLKVRKVYPEVKNGSFKTEFIFVGERPDNIRTGQTYSIDLQLGESTKSLMIPRGSFFQTTMGEWIFVLDPDGKVAYRRIIKIGRQNPTHYEVIEGLEKGEKVITSGYERFGTNERLQF